MSLRSLGLSKDPKDARPPSCFPDVYMYIAVSKSKGVSRTQTVYASEKE
jgi:hypothetical protein